MQPDSDIRKDFKELTDGLSKPNKISPTAEVTMEMAVRRSVLIGALRENRQVSVTADDGVTIPVEVSRATKLSSVTERDLRNISYGMMKGIHIKVSGVFPDPHDISHLTFKDKSSSVDKISLRNIIQSKSKLENSLIEWEDNEILEAALDDTLQFYERLRYKCDIPRIDWSLKATANDIVSSLDESVSEAFKSAEHKFGLITKTMERVRSKYEDDDYKEALMEWASNHPELLINTATEPKYGEVHKRSVRIFYMFEKNMKTYLSQFERIARIMGYYIKGAEIVKGDRAREKHMNILSSAYRSTEESVLAYQILFDLSKFSQKFNHRIIDAASRVISELVDCPEYAHISDLFKASFLYVSARNTNESFVGVMGAFEGFLNFLWTNIHATVMDIALRNCGRSGDLAAYSDDGLLMFTLSAPPSAPHDEIRKELLGVVESITKTYSDFGLDFNLGKTLISRYLAEFLGVIQYKGHRFPTWMKELCHLGIDESTALIKPIGQAVTDVSSQYTSLIKAGMPPFSASLIGYLEVLQSPGRIILRLLNQEIPNIKIPVPPNIKTKVIVLFLCLVQSFGGIRVPDPLTTMITADFDPISEMLADLKAFLKLYPECSGIVDYLLNSIEPTNDYLSLFMGSSPVNTKTGLYSHSQVKNQVISYLKSRIHLPESHPLTREKEPEVHKMLEGVENLYLPSVTSLVRYAIPAIEYSKLMAPSKSSALIRLLKPGQRRSIQSSDTKSFRLQLQKLIMAVVTPSERKLPDADSIYALSYPRLNMSKSLPSVRDLTKLARYPSEMAYEVRVSPLHKLDDRGTSRLMNTAFRDDLVPPLVTTDVNVQHLTSAPDVVSHCTRGLYSELISAAAQGHDITLFANEISRINNTGVIHSTVISSLRDIRKIAVANRKKSIHRVYWSEATKNSITLSRMGFLNYIMTTVDELHYSLVVTAALARSHLHLTIKDIRFIKEHFYIAVERSQVERAVLKPMKFKESYLEEKLREMRSSEMPYQRISNRAIDNEVSRALDSTRRELAENMLSGRMGMMPDFQVMAKDRSAVDPLKYAIVWTLVAKLDSVVAGEEGTSGVISLATRSYSLDNIPIELADYAMIYRSYKKVRKGEIGKFMDKFDPTSGTNVLEEDAKLLDEGVAHETILAAAALGLVHSLSVEGLMSKASVVRYNSILKAKDNSMIFYSLAPYSETDSTNVPSNARIMAIRRVVDSFISNYFDTADHTPFQDYKKIVMMIIRGSLRGTVHRDMPFNINVATNWLQGILATIIAFYEALDDELKVPKRTRKGLKYPTVPEDLREYLRERLEHNGDHLEMLDKGSPGQYRQLTQFIVKLAEWGAIQPLAEWPALRARITTRVGKADIQNIYHNEMVPYLAMARTVSYSTLEAALASYSMPAGIRKDITENFEGVLGEVNHMFGSTSSIQDMLSNLKCPDYRRERGTFEDMDIRISFRDFGDGFFGATLAYAMSIPLLLASGKTGYKKVIDMTPYPAAFANEDLEHHLSKVCLPLAEDRSEPILYLITGVSEEELDDRIFNLMNEGPSEKMISVEVPATSTAYSVGFLRWMANNENSYVTVGLSSDMRGVSIYAAALVSNPWPLSEPTTKSNIGPIYNMGDLAIREYAYKVRVDDFNLLSPLFLNQIHQCGIPCYASVVVDGTMHLLRTKEELLDTHRVSFCESSKPSGAAQVFSRIDVDKVAYLIRAMRFRWADNPPIINVISSSYYYYRAAIPTLPPDKLLAFLRMFVTQRLDGDSQAEAAKHIFDPIARMPNVSISSLHIDAQIKERSIENIKLENVVYKRRADGLIRSSLSTYEKPLVDKNHINYVYNYMVRKHDRLDPNELWEEICSSKDDEDVEYSGEPTTTRALPEHIESAIDHLEAMGRTLVAEDAIHKARSLELAPAVRELAYIEAIFKDPDAEAIPMHVPERVIDDDPYTWAKELADEWAIPILYSRHIDYLSVDQIEAIRLLESDEASAALFDLLDEREEELIRTSSEGVL